MGRYSRRSPSLREPSRCRLPEGGNKFGLKRWDEAYFARLKDFVAKAAEQEGGQGGAVPARGQHSYKENVLVWAAPRVPVPPVEAAASPNAQFPALPAKMR